MRELTIHDLDAELAEQLPARELMGRSCGGSQSFCPHQTETNIGSYGSGNYDGNGNGNGFLNVGSGDLNGNLNGNTVVVVV
jgi:hypothetical protein